MSAGSNGAGRRVADGDGGPHGPALAECAARRFGRLAGRHALSVSLADGSWLARAADTPFVAASVIKVPLLVLALAAAERGEFDPGERVQVERNDLATGSGLLRDLDDGLTLTWRDLLTLMMVISDNTATNLVLARLGVEAVNAALPGLGMPSTSVAGPLQVDATRQTPAQRAGRSATTTAADLHDVLRRLDDGLLLGPEATAWARDRLVGQRYREGIARLLDGPPGTHVVGSKGGWLARARHDAGIVWSADGVRLATVVVLSADHPTERFGPDHPAVLAIARFARDALALARP
ncbi:serine hydrolase [soil metagenome]